MTFRTVKVSLGKRSYPIIIGCGIIKETASYISSLNIGSDAYIITNNLIKRKFGAALADSLRKGGLNFKFSLVKDTEKSKSIDVAVAILKDMARFDKKKRLFVIALGGGVVGDLAGFITSIYRRGIPYIQIPTTLLAQVDSAVGGKTGVDLPQGKNLIGSFYQPRLVISDILVLNTLIPRQLHSGLAEVIKYGIIKDARLFAFLERNHKAVLSLSKPAILRVLESCVRIKAGIVEVDEREEEGLRTILNFGHTIGHAIEAAMKYRGYNHGEAIALGMLAASDMSKRLLSLPDTAVKRIEALIRAMGLPTKIRGVSIEKIINAHYYDKKFIGSRNRFVLIKDIAQTRIVQDVPIAAIKEALRNRAG